MGRTILIVDDSSLMLWTVNSTLHMAGFVVEKAEDGVVALNKLKGGLKPVLIITDINMPHMGGIELIQNVRAMPGLRFIPILAMTTESQAEKRAEGKKAGVTGWLVKPVEASQLLAVIKQVLPA